MKFTGCFGRKEIGDFITRPGAVLISITDPQSELIQLSEYNWAAILHLSFWDTIGSNGPSDDDALRIYSFIQKHWNTDIYAHCEAGFSRSGAVREFLDRRGWILRAQQKAKKIYPNLTLLTTLERLDRVKVPIKFEDY